MIEIEHFKLLLKYYFLTNKILTWLWILNIAVLVSKDFLHLILMKLSQFPYHIYWDFCKYKKNCINNWKKNSNCFLFYLIIKNESTPKTRFEENWKKNSNCFLFYALIEIENESIIKKCSGLPFRAKFFLGG